MIQSPTKHLAQNYARPSTRTAAGGLGIILTSLLALGCGSENKYPQSTPDAVLDTAVAMVENQDAGQLPDLVYADSADMRQALNRLGRLLDQAQSTALVLADAFPDEADQARERLEASGGSINLRSIGRANDPGGAAYDTLAAILAEPYAFLQGQRERLSTIELTDETSAITLDGNPVLPPFGLALRKAPDDDNPANTQGDWYVVAPLNLPFLSRFTPRTEEHWTIIAFLFKAWENVLADIEQRVEAKEITSLEDAAREAGKMGFPPSIAIVIAYRAALQEDD